MKYCLVYLVLSTLLQVTSSTDESSHKGLLCQLAESSQLLAQLGILVNEGLERILQENGQITVVERDTLVYERDQSL